jgi:outer membrane protein OmpA-like peptidoglycan-associated protein
VFLALRIDGATVYGARDMARFRLEGKRTLRSAGFRGCLLPALVPFVAVAAGLLPARDALAQSQTFTLDRMMVPGGPDDGIAIFRPVTQDKTLFFAQIGLGYSANPLHTVNVVHDGPTLAASSAAVIQGQITQYTTVGFEFLDRFIVAGTLPVTWGQWGADPVYGTNANFGGGNVLESPNTSGPAAGDLRLDARGVILRSRDRRAAFGAQVSMFVPTGTSAAFGGDGETTAMVGLSAEYSLHLGAGFDIIGVANTSIDFRPFGQFNQPSTSGNPGGQGLGIGDEWRWAVAAFLPLKDNKYRLGLTIFGQTGITNDGSTGNTFFANENTPIEWQAEGRMKFGKFDLFWAGAGLGSRLDQSYGAPDFRIIALVGMEVPFFEPDVASPEQKVAIHKRRPSELIDTDHDGIPDEIDACPTEPEDHLGPDPNDGCPLPPDRDHDGIPDQFDKCPDVPEDHKGSEPNDGCPDVDTDKDGIPDAVDACPHEPGQPSPDPKKNGCPQFIRLEGSSVRILQQVHFATGKADILPDSFPILQEIANLLKVTPSIHRMAIEGHTDNRGSAALNLHLSQARSESVMAWLVSHGIEQKRLEAHGYGMTRPIEDNNTEEGRLANRRVDFKIKDEGDSGGSAPPATEKGAAPKKPDEL